jgi:hypothetical protein
MRNPALSTSSLLAKFSLFPKKFPNKTPTKTLRIRKKATIRKKIE